AIRLAAEDCRDAHPSAIIRGPGAPRPLYPRPRGVAVKHATLSRWRSGVRIPSGSPAELPRRLRAAFLVLLVGQGVQGDERFRDWSGKAVIEGPRLDRERPIAGAPAGLRGGDALGFGPGGCEHAEAATREDGTTPEFIEVWETKK